MFNSEELKWTREPESYIISDERIEIVMRKMCIIVDSDIMPYGIMYSQRNPIGLTGGNLL